MSEMGVRMAIVYVSCAGDHAIHVLELAADGGLRTVEVTTVPAPDGESSSMPLALDGRHLFAAVRAAPYPASSFSVAADGRLRWLGSADLPAAMAYITTDGASRVLLGASYHGSVLMRMAIGADGVPRGPAQVIVTPPKAHSIITDPAGRWIYAAVLGGDAILRLDIDPASGEMVLRDRTAVRAGAGPRHLRFRPDGRFLYAINELDATVDAFAVKDGALAHVQTVALLPPGTTGAIAAADIHLTPDGALLFASERLSNTLSSFRVDTASGLLSPAGVVPAEASPRGFAIDPAGRFLLCAGQTSNHVTVHAISADGTLRMIVRHAVGDNPNWVTFLGECPA
jgi:6-phosphogluconolactonase